MLLCVFLLNSISVQAEGEREEKKSRAEGFLKKVIEAYQEQEETELAMYYSLNSIEGSTVAFESALFRSFRAEAVRVAGMECLHKENGYLYMGVSLLFTLKNGEEMPYYEYFLLYENEAKEYTMVPEEAYPLKIRKIIANNQEQWEVTELYLQYWEAANAYAASFPEYADTVYERLILLLNNIPEEMERNLRMAGVIFIMGIIQLSLLCLWTLYRNKYYD